MRGPRPSHLYREGWQPLPQHDPADDIDVLATLRLEVPQGAERYLEHRIDLLADRADGRSWWHHRLEYPDGVMTALVDSIHTMGRLTVWVAMVDHWRYPVGRWSRELPSGGTDYLKHPNETLAEAAARELCQETGWLIGAKHLNSLFPGPLQGSIGMAEQSYFIFEGFASDAEWVAGEPDDLAEDPEEKGQLIVRMHRLADLLDRLGREVIEPVTAASIARLALKYL
jgi:8-oxo-dGTP pyrophosphatase MutT (NUDIX family)